MFHNHNGDIVAVPCSRVTHGDGTAFAGGAPRLRQREDAHLHFEGGRGGFLAACIVDLAPASMFQVSLQSIVHDRSRLQRRKETAVGQLLTCVASSNTAHV